MKTRLVETRRDRRALVADAGIGGISLTSVMAGVLVAYGAFALGLAIAAGITSATGVDTDLSSDWERLGTLGALIVAGILFVSYLFGGYVAGRMARRSGVVHGLLVAFVGIVLVGVVAALVRQAADAQSLAANLRDLGLPTTADEYGNALTVAGIASLAALVLGSLFGGSLGERWHERLLTRAVDPEIGPEADARRRAAEEAERAEEARTRSYDRVRRSAPVRDDRADRADLADREAVAEGEAVWADRRAAEREGMVARSEDGNGRYDHDDDDDRGAGIRRRLRPSSGDTKLRSRH